MVACVPCWSCASVFVSSPSFSWFRGRFSNVSWVHVVLTSHVVVNFCCTCLINTITHARADCSGNQARVFARRVNGGPGTDRGRDGVRGVRYRGGVRGFRVCGCGRVADTAGGGSGVNSGACGAAAQVSNGGKKKCVCNVVKVTDKDGRSLSAAALKGAFRTNCAKLHFESKKLLCELKTPESRWNVGLNFLTQQVTFAALQKNV